MKRSLSCILLALLLVSCGGGDNGAGPGDGGNNNPPTPQPTAVGSPDGTATSATIGAGGGSVMSEDSLFVVTIPPGALASDTLITVQPITNTAWGGIGEGYRLTPHGLHFAAPVSLEFKVAPEDLEASAPEFLDVAVQNDQGFWYLLKNRSYDDGAQTLTATTTHFSDYSRIEGLQIRPARASVPTAGAVNLTLKYCIAETINDGEDILRALLYSCSDGGDEILPLGTFTNWSVNGIKGGNSNLGTVIGLGNGSLARYTAPDGVPLGNPVRVSVEAKDFAGIIGQLASRITVTGGGFSGDITRTTGSGAPGEHQAWHVTWTSLGMNGDFEEFTGVGTIAYTPQTLPCNTHTFAPTSASITTAFLIINRTVAPYTATVAVDAEWNVHECDDCGGVLDCHDYTPFSTGFSDGGIGTVSDDGNTISGSFTDAGSGETWSYQFTR